MTAINLSPYLLPTRFSASQGTVLGLRLLSAASPDLSPAAQAAADALREEVDILEELAGTQYGAQSTLRALGEQLASAWIGLRFRIEGIQRAGRADDAERAERVLARVFPRGTGFVQLKYPELWTTSNLVLNRLSRLGLTNEVAQLAGPDVLQRVRELHGELGNALGVRQTPYRPPNTRAIAEQITAVASAIVEYCRVLIGELDPNSEDSVERFRLAMAPLDAHRQELGRAVRAGRAGEAPAGEDSPSDNPDTPLELEAPQASGDPSALPAGNPPPEDTKKEDDAPALPAEETSEDLSLTSGESAEESDEEAA